MTNQDLKTGMQVTLRNGQRYLVLCDAENSSGETRDVLVRAFDATVDPSYRSNYSCGYIFLREYNDNLNHNNENSFDIMEVCLVPIGSHCDTLHPIKQVIWEREQESEEKETKMENYAIINGKKVNLSDEQIKQLNLSNIFNPSDNDVYYYIGTTGKLYGATNCNSDLDNKFKKIANCCTDKEILQQRALQETLNRLLWRFSMENGMQDIDWNNKRQSKYYIFYDCHEGTYEIGSALYFQTNGANFFSSREVAERAINEIILPFMEEHPDFKEKL